MKCKAWFIVTIGVFLTTPLLTVSAEQHGYNYSQILSSYCHSPIQHVVTATGQLKTTVVSFIPDQGELNRTESEIKKTDCNVWTVISEISQSEITVIINGLSLAPNDIFLITPNSRDDALCYDYNLTSQHDIFPKEVTSRHPIVLTWVRQVFQGHDAETRRQRLAFSCLAVGGADPSLEEKERVVLMGAIVISFFTVVATVLSITRSTKCSCCRLVCVFFKKFKKQPGGTDATTPDERLRLDQSDIRGGARHEETIILMEMEAPRNRNGVVSSLTTASGHGAQSQNGCDSVSLDRERNGLLTTEYAHNSDTDEEYSHSAEDSERATRMFLDAVGNDAENYVITVPSPGMSMSSQSHGRHDSTRPIEPSLSELLGELPVYSPTPQENVTASRPSPFAFMTSLLPARLQHQTRPSSSSSHSTLHGTHPMVYFSSPPVRHTDTTVPHCGQVHFTIGGHQVLRVSRALSPLWRNYPLDSSSDLRIQGADVESNLSDSPPPPYSELPPPAYNSLFPNRC